MWATTRETDIVIVLLLKSSTLGVIGLAGMSLPGNGAAGEVNGVKRGAKYRKNEHLDNYFRFD